MFCNTGLIIHKCSLVGFLNEYIRMQLMAAISEQVSRWGNGDHSGAGSTRTQRRQLTPTIRLRIVNFDNAQVLHSVVSTWNRKVKTFKTESNPIL